MRAWHSMINFKCSQCGDNFEAAADQAGQVGYATRLFHNDARRRKEEIKGSTLKLKAFRYEFCGKQIEDSAVDNDLSGDWMVASAAADNARRDFHLHFLFFRALVLERGKIVFGW